MSSNAYIFSVIVAVIGMVTVFVGLTLLSLMMLLLRRFFSAEEPPIPGEVRLPIKASVRPVVRDIRWVTAAAAIYLSDEGRPSVRSAASWLPKADAKQDPWINRAGF